VSTLSVEPGPWYWVNIAYAYLALAGMAVMIARHLGNKGDLYRRHCVALLAAPVLPLAGSLLYLTGLSPFGRLDLTPVTLSATAFCLLASMRRMALFDVVPVARDQVVEYLTDGVLVLDRRGRLVDANPGARRWMGWEEAPLGMALDAWFPGDWTRPEPGRMASHVVSVPGAELELRTLSIGEERGTVLLLRDITRRRRLEREREDLIEELRRTLANVKRLQGLLPICANCKSIRDDKGYWTQVEVYLKDHGEMTFSHGICPKCMKKYYGRDA
jgi:PAS domain-containing protein